MGRVYASADWHGCIAAHQILEYLKPDDKLYFLGDSIDRGPHGLEYLKKLLYDPRVIYIMGNHEDMMIRGIKSKWDRNLWFNNGGKKTFYDILSLPEQESLDILKKVEHLSYKETYINKDGKEIILEHAGYTPWDIPHRTHDPLWDRHHFDDLYNSKGANTYMIHGHTPVQYLQFLYGYINQPPKTKEDIKLKNAFLADEDMGDWKPTILYYCNNHKIDIDMCTITSGRVALLDLDTFEEIYFDEKEKNDDEILHD